MEASQKWSPIRGNRKFTNNLPLVVSRVIPILANTKFCSWPVGQPEVSDIETFFTRVCKQLFVFESQMFSESGETGAGWSLAAVGR